jgi:hypothetical protein
MLGKEEISVSRCASSTFTTMNNLAGLYFSQGKYDQAEALFVECLLVSGDKHPNTLNSLNNLH